MLLSLVSLENEVYALLLLFLTHYLLLNSLYPSVASQWIQFTVLNCCFA